MSTLDEIRDAARLLLENTDEHDFDDDRNTCRGCGWDSKKDKPLPVVDLPNAWTSWHKPGCELSAARLLLIRFVDGDDVLSLE